MSLPITYTRTVAADPASVRAALGAPGIALHRDLPTELREHGIFAFEVDPTRTGARFTLPDAGQSPHPLLTVEVRATPEGANVHVKIRRSRAALIVPACIAALQLYTFQGMAAFGIDDAFFSAMFVLAVRPVIWLDASERPLVDFLRAELDRRLATLTADISAS